MKRPWRAALTASEAKEVARLEKKLAVAKDAQHTMSLARSKIMNRANMRTHYETTKSGSDTPDRRG